MLITISPTAGKKPSVAWSPKMPVNAKRIMLIIITRMSVTKIPSKPDIKRKLCTFRTKGMAQIIIVCVISLIAIAIRVRVA